MLSVFFHHITVKDGKEKLLGTRQQKQLILKSNILHIGHESKLSTGCQQLRPLVFVYLYWMDMETKLTFSLSRHTFREETLISALWIFIISGIDYFLKKSVMPYIATWLLVVNGKSELQQGEHFWQSRLKVRDWKGVCKNKNKLFVKETNARKTCK